MTGRDGCPAIGVRALLRCAEDALTPLADALLALCLPCQITPLLGLL